MTLKRSNISLDYKLISSIDEILPKLKYSVGINKILRWLENFELADTELALEFLFFLEFIDFAELTNRIDEQLKNIFKTVPKNFRIYIYPGVASYPKSAEIINYLIKETPSFKNRKSKYHCLITRDLVKDLDRKQESVIILVDDFIGTGKSFKKGYYSHKIFKSKNAKSPDLNLKKWLDLNINVKRRFLLSSICMSEGEQFIISNFPEIKISAEIRFKLFDPLKSPFKATNKVSEMRNIAVKYGNLIRTSRFAPYHDPLGFNDCEALVSFAHTTPNNTLPIIWSGAKWNPIFPRFGVDKIKSSKEIKTEAAFYIGIMNRLGLDLFSKESIWKSGRRKITENKKIENHRLLCVIKLQIDGFELPSICQILGITTTEYRSILRFGVQQKLIGRNGIVNNLGRRFYKETLEKIGPSRFRKKDKIHFEMKNKIYVPKRFGGMT